MYLGMVLLVAAAASAPPPVPVSQIALGARTLTIGMSKAGALQALSSPYKVNNPEGDSWTVLIPAAEVFRFKKAAILSFKDGKLEQVTKYWAQGDSADAGKIATALYSMLDGRVPEEMCPIDVSLIPYHEADYEAKSILITDRMNGRRFDIVVTTNEGYTFVEVSETIGDIRVLPAALREFYSRGREK